MALYEPITKQMKIDVRMNLKTRKVELKTTKATEDEGALQKSADFVQAFLLGFEIQDAVALLRLDDLYLECFEVKDVKQTLKGEHMSRGIGRLAGKSGKTKFTIENATRTRIVIADQHIRILGSFQNIKIARDALCNLILGSPPGKVYSRLRSITARSSGSEGDSREKGGGRSDAFARESVSSLRLRSPRAKDARCVHVRRGRRRTLDGIAGGVSFSPWTGPGVIRGLDDRTCQRRKSRLEYPPSVSKLSTDTLSRDNYRWAPHLLVRPWTPP